MITVLNQIPTQSKFHQLHCCIQDTNCATVPKFETYRIRILVLNLLNNPSIKRVCWRVGFKIIGTTHSIRSTSQPIVRSSFQYRCTTGRYISYAISYSSFIEASSGTPFSTIVSFMSNSSNTLLPFESCFRAFHV